LCRSGHTRKRKRTREDEKGSREKNTEGKKQQKRKQIWARHRGEEDRETNRR
jgi:hypothetical protein